MREQKANEGSYRRFQRRASRNIELRVNPKRPPASQAVAVSEIEMILAIEMLKQSWWKSCAPLFYSLRSLECRSLGRSKIKSK
jgi:hypothetical protein